MRKNIFVLILLILIALGYAFTCRPAFVKSDKSNITDKLQSADSVTIGENSYYIECNKSGKEKVTIIPVPDMAFGIFNPSQNATLCGVGGYEGKEMTVDFEGNKPGTFTDKSRCQVKAGNTYNAVKLEVKVNKYGDIGELIEGTFSGIFVNTITDSGDTCEVTDGKFSVIRKKRGY